MAMTEQEKEEWRRKHNEELASRTKEARKKQRILERAERAEKVHKMAASNARRVADKDEVAAYYTEVMRDETADYSERTAAARELQRLQGWEKVQVSESAGDIAAAFLSLMNRTSAQKPVWQRNLAINDPNVIDLQTPK